MNNEKHVKCHHATHPLEPDGTVYCDLIERDTECSGTMEHFNSICNCQDDGDVDNTDIKIDPEFIA